MTRFGVGWPWGIANAATHAQSIRNMGCAEVRIPVNWNQIEQKQGEYKWDVLDGQVATIRSKGMGVCPIVYRTPAWHRPAHQDPPDPTLYSNFCVRVLDRYHFPVIEVWNEENWPLPDSPYYPLDWKGTGEQYAALYKQARVAINAQGAQAIVGGLAYPNGIEYLGYIWPKLGPVDAVGWHPYGFGTDPVADSWKRIERMAKFLTNRGSKAPIEVTEIGLPVGLADPHYTEKERATYLKALASKVQGYKRVRRFCVYTWHNQPEWDIANADGSWKGGAGGYRAGIKG